MAESIIVAKLGGTEGVDFSAICNDAVELLKQGKRLVFVHGGSTEANALGEALGAPPKMITSPSGYTSRYTDRKTLEIFLMAVNGKVNSLLTEQLQMLGVNAFGLCGLDGRLMQATRKESVQSIENGKRKIIRDDYTGKIETVNSELLMMLLNAGYLPVIAPVAVSEKGEASECGCGSRRGDGRVRAEGGDSAVADGGPWADEKLPRRVHAHSATAAESTWGGG
jgi:acetylglutamate/LysW-gamma-L-alpha-aminoadipate kinase